MPRAAVVLAGVAVLLSVGAAAEAAVRSPHLDGSLVPASCTACHEGHGSPRSPMLPSPQRATCLACHDTRAAAEQRVLAGVMAPGADPALLSSALAQPYQHPISNDTYTASDPSAVTCGSCHSPHRGMASSGVGASMPGGVRPSPKSPMQPEFELCQTCHQLVASGGGGRLLSPSNRSYHPVEAPAAGSSPSLRPELSGYQINCTDCHGNDDRQGARGPHGSGVRHLLRAAYTTLDGATESSGAYELCFRCHERELVLDSAVFPQHRRHVEDERASCATCHNPHGSVENRALIRFGEEPFVPGVSPSAQTGKLTFVSSSPGSGACFLTCHGKDHGPEVYGLGSGEAASVMSLIPVTLQPTRFPENPKDLRPGRSRDGHKPPP